MAKIVIVGMMGVGKSTVGKKLARRLLVPFYDSDRIIENQENLSVVDIFAFRGEEYFNKKEQETIENLLNCEEDFVLSTGGQSFVNPTIRSLIKKRALSIWLKVDEEDILYERIKRRNTRPHFNNTDQLNMLRDLYKQNYPIYNEADIKIDVSHFAAFELPGIILKEIRGLKDNAGTE